MILLRSGKLKLNFIRELGIDHIKNASPQRTHHHKKLQLTFMIQGTLTWKFPDGRMIQLHGGEYCLTQPGDKFDVLYDVISPCYLMWIIIDPLAGNAEKGTCFSKNELTEMGSLLTSSGNPVRKISQAMSFYLKEIREIIQDCGKEKISTLDMNKIRLCLMSIFIESIKLITDNNPSANLAGTRLGSQVKELVLKQPTKNLSVEELAALFKLSASLFGKKFKKETGISLADFVRRVKLEESLRLMCGKSKNITEIAHFLGFSSSQYFATLFKKYFGKTPKEFKTK